MMAVAPHLFDLSPNEHLVCWEYDISIRCGLLSYPFQGQCEKPTNRVRQYVPAPYFIIKAYRGDSEAMGFYEKIKLC